jgi:hypothetical protein
MLRRWRQHVSYPHSPFPADTIGHSGSVAPRTSSSVISSPVRSSSLMVRGFCHPWRQARVAIWVNAHRAIV